METNRTPLGVLSDTGRPERRRIYVMSPAHRGGMRISACETAPGSCDAA